MTNPNALCRNNFDAGRARDWRALGLLFPQLKAWFSTVGIINTRDFIKTTYFISNIKRLQAD